MLYNTIGGLVKNQPSLFFQILQGNQYVYIHIYNSVRYIFKKSYSQTFCYNVTFNIK